MTILFDETKVDELLNSIPWEEKEVTFQVDKRWGEKRTIKVNCYKGLCYHQSLTIRFLNGVVEDVPTFTVSHVGSGYSVVFFAYEQTFYTWRYAALFLIKIADLIDWTMPSEKVIEAARGEGVLNGYHKAYKEAYLDAMHFEESLGNVPRIDPETMFTWDEDTYVCDFCGSQNNRVGGMKAHIRNVHMQPAPAPGREG